MVLITGEEVAGRIWGKSMKFPSFELLENSHFGIGTYSHTNGATLFWSPNSFSSFSLCTHIWGKG